MHECLFIICVIVYNLYYCYYAKTSSPAVQIRHSKVYGNPIAPSLYSILLGWTTVKSCKISLELAYIITLFTLISLGGIHGGYSVHRRLKCTPEDKDMKYLGIILYIGGHGVWGGYTVCMRLWCIKCVILYSVQRGYS